MFTHHKIHLEEELHFSCLNLSSNCILIQLIQKYSETYKLYKNKINASEKYNFIHKDIRLILINTVQCSR